jgi:hypothetical protein
MRGIMFTNGSLEIEGLTGKESIKKQLEVIQQYFKEKHIEVTTLNTNQIYKHYTILHALLFDLEKNKAHLDCFVTYSNCATERFKSLYPEKWEQLVNHFTHIIELDSWIRGPKM